MVKSYLLKVPFSHSCVCPDRIDVSTPCVSPRRLVLSNLESDLDLRHTDSTCSTCHVANSVDVDGGYAIIIEFERSQCLQQNLIQPNVLKFHHDIGLISSVILQRDQRLTLPVPLVTVAHTALLDLHDGFARVPRR